MSEDNNHQENEPQENHEMDHEEEIAFNHDQDINQPTINENPSTKKLKDIHEIVSEEENKTYTLKFIPVGDNIKILLSEQDNFPAKIYEIYLALEELQLKSELFSGYSSSKELSEQLNKSDNNINYFIRKKPENIMALTIKFASEEENNDNFIEIDLNENIIDNREMFRQLFEKYKSIQKEQEEDISQFLNRLKNIEEILKVHEEPPVEENQNQENQENQEMQGELQNEEGHEQQLEGKSEEKNIEEQREIKEEKEEIKSSNKESMSSIQKGNNVKKGKVEKNKEEKKKNIKKKKS
jgi:hypothetical protein